MRDGLEPTEAHAVPSRLQFPFHARSQPGSDWDDGEWHHLAIPLSDFTATGLKLTAVNAPFVFISGTGAAADKLLIDNLYFTAE